MAVYTREQFNDVYKGPLHDIKWNLGRPVPGLRKWLHDFYISEGPALVPCCGLGYDAVLLAELGFDVSAVDFSALALAYAKRLARASSVRIEFFEDDVLKLNRGSFSKKYRLVLDTANMQSFRDTDRRQYIHTLSELIHPSGLLITTNLCYDKERPQEYPRGLTPKQLTEELAPKFSIVDRTTTDLYSAAGFDGFALFCYPTSRAV